MLKLSKEVFMEQNDNVKIFLDACDEFIECKFLVAEYKLQRMLKVLAQTEEVCSLVGECLEQFNREREFAKAYIQDGHGEFVCDMPDEEYKIIALVFCTLVDIDNKKIDFIDFVKRFFGREDNPFHAFVLTMVVPFRNLIADAFGYKKLKFVEGNEEIETSEFEDEENDEEYDDEDEDKVSNSNDEGDEFVEVQKIAVQIISELQYAQQSQNVVDAIIICKSIVKTTDLRDSDITYSLALALRAYKVKQVKFLVKEILNILNI